MSHSIVAIEQVEKEAKAAAEAGIPIRDSCRFPYDTPAGQVFIRTHIYHVEALRALGQQQAPQPAQGSKP
ncbi:MAG TPA: hypothetical protein VFF19_01250 [Reyranella sp.]|nr:hypothetical protein [Reyranella sp.]